MSRKSLRPCSVPAAIRGLQGPRLGATDDGILACAKHFVGDGGTHRGTDRGNTVVTAEALLAHHLKQYEAAIAAGVGSIMVSFSSVNGKKMHASRELLTDLLKNEMQFQGFLISDWAAVELLPGDYATQVESAINAGVDMVMGSNNFRSFQKTLTSLVPNRVPEARIDDAVTRILTVKCELGLFEPSRSRPWVTTIGSREHREIAREAVQKSLVLLKKQGRPLATPEDRATAARRWQERRRSGAPVRWLDDRLAGAERRHYRRHDDSSRDRIDCHSGNEDHLFARCEQCNGRRSRRSRCRRATLCRGQRRSPKPRAR